MTDSDKILSKSIRPMLAVEMDEKNVKFTSSNSLFVQPKLDGIRCMI